MTNASPITFTFQFSETVTGFDATDVTITNGTKGTFTATDGDTYTLLVTPSADGTVTASVAANAAQDVANNNNALTSGSVTSDRTVPTLTVSPNSGATNASPITFTFQFSETVTGFDASDVSVTNGTKGTFTATDGDTYTLLVTPSADGTVTASVAANAAQDVANNNNALTSGSVTSDRTVPTLTVSPNSGATNASPITFTFQFSETVTGFDATDVTLTNGTKGTFTATDGDTYTLLVTPTADGTVTASVAANAAQDAATNKNALTSGSVTSDRTAPTGTFTAVTPDPRFTAVSSVSINFSESVTGVGISDFTLTKDGTPVALTGATIDGSGTAYTLNGLSSLTNAAATYVLSLKSSGTGIVDVAGNEQSAGATELWLFSSTTVVQTGNTLVITDVGGNNNVGNTSDNIVIKLDPNNSGNFLLTYEGQTYSQPINGVTNVVINGGTGDDTLTLDVGNGELPFLITFNGGLGFDTLHIKGLNEAFDSYTVNYDNKTDGNVQFRNGQTVESKLIFTGLDPLTIDGTPKDVVLNMPKTNDSAILSEVDANTMKLSSTTFETTTFSIAAATSLTINGGLGNDVIRVDSIAANYTGVLNIIGGLGSDQLIVDFAGGTSRYTGGINYDGTPGPADAIILRNTGAKFDSLTYRTTTRFTGNFTLIDDNDFDDAPALQTASLITFKNIGRASLDGTATAELVFDLPATNDNVALSDTPAVGAERFESVSGVMMPLDFNISGVSSLIVNGNNGNDKVTIKSLDNAFRGRVELTGGEGNDILDATGSKTIKPKTGVSPIVITPVNVLIYGGNGNDNITGGIGNDTLLGEGGNDTIAGGDGNDAISGGSGNDKLDGGNGNDTLLGDAGKDTLTGGNGADLLLGGDDDDNLNGGTAPAGQHDTLAGQAGKDVIADPLAEIDEAFTFDFNALLV